MSSLCNSHYFSKRNINCSGLYKHRNPVLYQAKVKVLRMMILYTLKNTLIFKEDIKTCAYFPPYF